MIRSTSYILVALAFASAATAEHWEIDGAHSTVGFQIRHMMVSKVNGTFTKFSGGIDVEGTDPTTAKLNVEIDTASVNTGNDKRDDHLRTADFFDAPKYPKITYVSKKVEKTDAGLKVTGDLTMHGVTKEVVLDIEGPTDPVIGPKKMARRGASATGKLNRKDFGLTWSNTMDGGGVVLGDEIKLNLEAELVEQPAGGASPSPSPAK